MDFSRAIHQLGVRDDTLSAAEKQSLDRDGYLVLENIFTIEQAERMLEANRQVWQLARDGREGVLARIQNVIDTDAYDICFTHPRVLAAVGHVLGEEFMSGGVHTAAEDWPPPDENQSLHTDCRGEVSAEKFCCCNSMWPLTDFTADNGPTRVVPGSHLFGAIPADALEDPNAPHPDEIRLILPVGHVAVFNAHVWHGATQNPNRLPRANLTSFWVRRYWSKTDAEASGVELDDNNRAASRVTAAVWDRLSDAAQCLFDPPED